MAQAGQGKTTFIQQYLKQYSLSFCWYQLGEEDGDPFFMAQALLFALLEKFPALQGSISMEMANNGSLSAADLPQLANSLLHDLAKVVQEPLYLIFDDLHFIKEQQASLDFLVHLIAASPAHLHFILASRAPVAMPVKVVNPGANTVCLGNADLALNEGETHSYLSRLADGSVSTDLSHQLHSATEGWPMGICAMAFSGVRPGSSAVNVMASTADCYRFLQEEVWQNIGVDQQQLMLKLCLLEQIPVQLADVILARHDSARQLTELAKGNLFIRVHGNQRDLFSFHHLYCEFLRAKAHELLTQAEINGVWHDAAVFFNGKGEVDTALAYLAMMADYDAIEELLASHGMQIIAANRPHTLARLLKKIPPEVVSQYGWISFFAGLVQIDAAPRQALPMLLAALAYFDNRGDSLGSLLACARIIYGHFIGTGSYNEGSLFLSRAEELYTDLQDELPVYHRIFVEMNLAVGFCFFRMDRLAAEKYGQHAARLAKDNSMHNFLAASRFVLASIYHLLGNRYLFSCEAEEARDSIFSPFVGTLHKMSLEIIQLSYLQMHGDFDNYFRLRDALISHTHDQVLEQTFARSSFRIWEATIEVSLGNYDKASHLLHLEESSSLGSTTAHMKSVFLQWRAYVAALRSERDGVVAWCEESMALRQVAGGPFYEVLNLVVVGATYAALAMEEATDILNRAVAQAAELDSAYLLACSHLQRGCWRLGQGDENGREDIEVLVELMARHRYGYLWTITPDQVEFLQGFCATACLKPLNELLVPILLQAEITAKGKSIPLLELTSFGEMKGIVQGEVVFRGVDFTPAQRQVMAMLLAAPQFSLNQSTVELVLWPDAEPEKARANFEMLLMRLRKTINKFLISPLAKEYLQLKRGVLRLCHCRADLQLFNKYAEKGISCFGSRKFWQAENYFYLATALWQGGYFPEASGNSLIWSCRDSSLQSYLKLVRDWAAVLMERQEFGQAMELIDQALLFDGLNIELVSLSYLLRQKSTPGQTRKVVDRYRQALVADDFSEDEIAEMVAGLLAEVEMLSRA